VQPIETQQQRGPAGEIELGCRSVKIQIRRQQRVPYCHKWRGTIASLSPAFGSWPECLEQCWQARWRRQLPAAAAASWLVALATAPHHYHRDKMASRQHNAIHSDSFFLSISLIINVSKFPYGKWRPAAVRWCTINGYRGHFTFLNYKIYLFCHSYRCLFDRFY